MRLGGTAASAAVEEFQEPTSPGSARRSDRFSDETHLRRGGEATVLDLVDDRPDVDG
jgi:hypothetical protein